MLTQRPAASDEGYIAPMYVLICEVFKQKYSFDDLSHLDTFQSKWHVLQLR